MTERDPNCATAQLFLLFCYLYTERFESAMETGKNLLKVDKNHPTGLLATAVAMLHQSVKRTCRVPQELQLSAFALLFHYRNLVQSDEGNYNLARAFHMVGVLDLACRHYRMALDGVFGKEAAYNLHLIALLNGETALAKHYLDRIVI